MMLQYDFTGRAAVVTGAAGGMGKAVARGILTAGGAVAMIDVKPEPEDLGRFGGRVLYAQGDLTDESFVRRTIDAAAERFGRLDYLANIAGVLWFGRDASLLDMDMCIWDQVFAINLKSMVHTSRAVVPHMRKAGGGAMVHFSPFSASEAIPSRRMPIRRRRPASGRCRARSPCRVLLDHGGA
jgi:NAD(P)-dependent dehydrogenase (short-subunit alcohol dehydrogenase family)